MLRPRVWLITGASSGFGRAVTEVVLKKGDIAVATLRDPAALDDLVTITDPARLLVLKCDVTIREEISNVFQKTVERFGRCDVVFNNAGYAVVAEIEGTPDDAARALFDANFWGAANVSREAMRVFREVNEKGRGGRLLTMSSSQGFYGLPALGYYSASKHAVDGFTETLAMELDPTWNIKISLLAPTNFQTKALKNGVTFPPIPAYSDPSLPSHRTRLAFEKDALPNDVDRAAERIYHFAGVDSPPMRWAIGTESVAGTRKKLKAVGDETDEYERWSDNLVSR